MGRQDRRLASRQRARLRHRRPAPARRLHAARVALRRLRRDVRRHRGRPAEGLAPGARRSQ